MTANPAAAPTAPAASRRERPTLRVRTTVIDALPQGPAALIDLLPDERPLAWVHHGDGIVGWGEAMRLVSWGAGRFADAEAAWRTAVADAVVDDDVALPGTGLVGFGSFAFDESLTPNSTVRPAGSIVVPRVIVGRRDGVCWMTTIDTADNAASPATVLATPRAPVRRPVDVHFGGGAVSTDEWKHLVTAAVERILAGDLDKVVLARDVVARSREPLDARWMLGRLAAAYPQCWTFSVDGMIGATPELLLRSRGTTVGSRVLAGTVHRDGADDPTALSDLTHKLTGSAKDIEEHQYAATSVARALAPYCSSMNVPESPFVLQLPNVMHLATDITGTLAQDATGGHPSSLTLAAALHPTAAVCGTPTQEARELIRKIEGMDRGRYAGPVGWIDATGDGEWGIALRSAEFIDDDPYALRLFAGCGIVAASDPAAELAESEAKLEPLRYALRG